MVGRLGGGKGVLVSVRDWVVMAGGGWWAVPTLSSLE